MRTVVLHVSKDIQLTAECVLEYYVHNLYLFAYLLEILHCLEYSNYLLIGGCPITIRFIYISISCKVTTLRHFEIKTFSRY